MNAPWFARWAQWRLGTGPYKGHRGEHALRPSTPRPVPVWARFKLWHILARRHELTEAQKRMGILTYCSWAISHEPSIHYGEARPMPKAQLADPFKLPMTIDCSTFFTLAYKAAGCADPNGFAYDGWGNTDTLLTHGQRVSEKALRIGDACLFLGPDYGRHHVCVVMEPGENPVLASHGTERGPLAIRLSEEAVYHKAQPVIFCTFEL